MKQLPLIVITTGDHDGIGAEVTFKALSSSDLPLAKYLIFSSSRCPLDVALIKKKHLNSYQSPFQDPDSTLNWMKELPEKDRENSLIVHLTLDTPAAEWVILSSRWALEKKIDGLVTGPLSKEQMRQDGFKEIGHTGLFRSLVPDDIFMLFLGTEFHTLLLTDHIPLSEVESRINFTLLSKALQLSFNLMDQLNDLRPIAVLGLNPHCGEKGLMGFFEEDKLKPWLKKINSDRVVGPIPPDSAFIEQNRCRFSLFISLYHDQGLLPFKTVHGQDSGTQFSLGLPFFRTSVDHGTAKDRFLLNSSNPLSMIDSIAWLHRLILSKRT